MPPTTAPAVGTDLKDLMQEIVVTARRREEKLVDTPISITAFFRCGIGSARHHHAHG